MQEVGSAEFSDWIGFYTIEAEQSGETEREPTPGERWESIKAWAVGHNARLAAQGRAR